LPPLRLGIPARDYVLDAGQADERQVQQFFSQPPVEQVQRLYSISEVKRSARIRDMVRRLEIGDLTFDTGAATLSPDQVGALNNVANAMLQLLQQNPAETFLIEGHTDAVGSDIRNLQLSDARAATVAGILTDAYHIPPENLATQGYGAQFLKVETNGPERLNRRVTVRRITALVTVANRNQ
jgi:outer membrane protein OmpA-like peptidoglycan-associated protein